MADAKRTTANKKHRTARHKAVEVEEDDEDESLDMESPPASMSSACSEMLQIQKQAMFEMVNMLKETLTAPRPSVLTFDGDPIQYYRFLSSFEAGVKNLDDPQIKLNYLIQNCTGDAKEAVEDCVILPPNEGYSKALEILKKRFGRPHEIARSYIRDLVNGLPMKPSDLNRFSVKMNRASMTLNQMGYRADLDNSENLLQIVRRLPMHLRSKWADKADSIIEDGEEPRFDDLAAFIERQARVASSMYGQDLEVPTKIPSHPPAPQKTKGAAYYTTRGPTNVRKCQDHTALIDEAPESPIIQSRMGRVYATQRAPIRKPIRGPVCAYCAKSHQTWRCYRFIQLKYDDRRNVTRKKGLCDNCLGRGHLSRDCRKPKLCRVTDCRVRYKHDTLLHPPRQQAPRKCDDRPQRIQDKCAPRPLDDQRTPPVTRTNDRRMMAKDDRDRTETRHGRSYAIQTSNAVSLKVVPVKVTKGGRTVETYAMIDSCSDVTLCSDSLMKKLKVTGEKKPLTLTTMSDEVQREAAVVDMKVSPVSGKTSVHLDEVWAIDKLQIPTDSIATQRDANSWPHLCGILLPKTDATEVELLIGGDVPEVTRTLEERRGGRREPYAIRTILGWTIIGPVKRKMPNPASGTRQQPTPEKETGRKPPRNSVQSHASGCRPADNRR